MPGHLLKHSTPWASRGVKVCEAPYPDEAGTYGFLSGMPRSFRHPFIFEMKDEPAFKPQQGIRAFF